MGACRTTYFTDYTMDPKFRHILTFGIIAFTIIIDEIEMRGKIMLLIHFRI